MKFNFNTMSNSNMKHFNKHLVENDVVLDLSEYIKNIKDISSQETIDSLFRSV